MEAIVLAGGLGTRLRTVVPNLPKPMAPIGNQPFLEILLGSLARKGFRRVVLSLGHMAEIIATHFGENFAGMTLAYVVEDAPLGTGGAVRLAMTRCEKGHVFVFNGDTYLDLEAAEVERLWHQQGNPIIVGREVQDTSRYGRPLMTAGRITGFTEKGIAGPGLINAGCYVLSRHQLDRWSPNTPFSLEADYFADAVKAGPVNLFETRGLFIDIGIPEDFRRAQTLLAGMA